MTGVEWMSGRGRLYRIVGKRAPVCGYSLLMFWLQMTVGPRYLTGCLFWRNCSIVCHYAETIWHCRRARCNALSSDSMHPLNTKESANNVILSCCFNDKGYTYENNAIFYMHLEDLHYTTMVSYLHTLLYIHIITTNSYVRPMCAVSVESNKWNIHEH